MIGDVNIDRCTCFQVTFEELWEIAARTGAESVEDLQNHREFGLQCRLCHSYVRRMLRTGCTAFDRIITEEDEASSTL